MPKENIYQTRRILPSKLTVIVAGTSEELTVPENHFSLSDEEKILSRLQLFAKKAKTFYFDKEKKPSTKVTALCDDKIILSGKVQALVSNSIMQNEELFTVFQQKANEYLDKVLKVPVKDEKHITYLDKMAEQLYQLIKKSSPKKDETIHLATMERELVSPDCGKNRLTAEFCNLLLTELRKKIAENKDQWIVEADRVFGVKHRTARAESNGIDRLALLPLMLYQSRNMKEEIIPSEKLIIVDDHIHTGSSISSAATSAIDQGANLLGVTCITTHRNGLYFNIQANVIEFITALLPKKAMDLPKLNKILGLVGLRVETLTNVEGLILAAILIDAKNTKDCDTFLALLNECDLSRKINYSLFENQKNSLLEELKKEKVEFSNFEANLRSAMEKRSTVPLTKQIVLSDQEGQNIRKELDKRAHLPWLLFDFDKTLHHMKDKDTYIVFQNIIKKFSGKEVPIETIMQQRQVLKRSGDYQYQEMLMNFIKEQNPDTKPSHDEISKEYQVYKNEEPFKPKMSREDFLHLRKKYRIGIITDGSEFPSKVSKIKEFYGVDIDGYVSNKPGVKKKPDTAMYAEFYSTFIKKAQPVAYVGDDKELDGGMAAKANLNFIKVNPLEPVMDMEEFTKKLTKIEALKKTAREQWGFLQNKLIKSTTKSQRITAKL